MWWECSECGEHTEQSSAPVLCESCGTAGVLFVPAGLEVEPDEFRLAWLTAGLKQARSRAFMLDT